MSRFESSIGSKEDDADCDGVLTVDGAMIESASAARADDGDCDGVLTADDCDDNDSAKGARSLDQDCIRSVTSRCDDNDPGVGASVNVETVTPYPQKRIAMTKIRNYDSRN